MEIINLFYIEVLGKPVLKDKNAVFMCHALTLSCRNRSTVCEPEPKTEVR